jgi:hypothetical protein
MARSAGEAAHGGDEHHCAAAVDHGAAAELRHEVRVAEDHPEVPVPVLVGAIDDGAETGLADDVDDAVEAPERPTGVGDQSRGVVAHSDVAGPRRAADLGRHGVGAVTLDVGADDTGSRRCQRVCGVSADPPAGPDDDEAAPVETQQTRIVGHRAAIESVHGAAR